MFNRSLKFALAAGLSLTACSTPQKHSSGQRSVASAETWANSAAVEMSNGALSNFSSGGSMNLSKAAVITDNNRAFQGKLDIVRKARKELRLVYYIYSDDFSSSLLTTEILAAARRGVKVKILVDFITNYERLDLFSYMEAAGQGNLEVRFYGLPTAGILRSAVYQTLPCSKDPVKAPEQCQSEKTATMTALGNPETTWFSKIYLTGLYGKNPTLMKAAIGLGGQFDPKTLMAGAPSTPEDKARLKKFAQLLIAAKMKNDLAAKIKLGIALQTYGSTLNPIMNELTGRLPIAMDAGKDWDHLTDFTHHKLIVADGERFQLGGRNIEDSYHTDELKKQIKDSTGKYTFLDTDFNAESRDSRNVEEAYDRLFNFGPMVGGIAKIQALVPNEYEINTESFGLSLGACLQEGKATPGEIETCVNVKMPSTAGFRSREARLQSVRDNMGNKSQRFAAEYRPSTDNSWRATGDSLSASDLSGASAFYVENLPWAKSKPNERSFGSKIGLEAASGKGLHAAWVKGLENACATSTKSKVRKQVVLHSAYLYLPSPLINALGNMINGKWKCSYVDIAILTNSFETTDLNVINVFARYQLQALLAFNKNIEQNSSSYVTANQYKAKLKYYEYLPAGGPGVSLHSKVSLLGDDMIIGSANADVRSYFMDTNNGIYVRNAPQMVSDYSAYVNQLISSRKVEDFTALYANISDDMIRSQNRAILAALLGKWDKKGQINSQRQAAILKYLDEMGGKIRGTTQSILNAPFSLSQNAGNFPEGGNNGGVTAAELEEAANSFDQLWKML